MEGEEQKLDQKQTPNDGDVIYHLKSAQSGTSKIRKDSHGQPHRLFKVNLENNVSKAIDQLSGICTGMLADGVVNDKEATFFREWVRNHAEMEPVWPFTDILRRVEHVFDHGQIGEDERKELGDIMRSICGGDEAATDPNLIYSSKLPLDEPPPTVTLKSNEFVVTGRFAYGTRQKVTEAITSHGGFAKDGFPTLGTRYLVIGEFASRDWYNTNYGRKIERAVELRNSSAQIAIISEEHWKCFLL